MSMQEKIHLHGVECELSFSVHARVPARVYAVGRVAWLNYKQYISSGNEQT